MRDYEIVSTDSHLEVSPDSGEPYVDAEFREYVPKVVQLPGGGDAWLMPGKSQPVPLGLNFSAGRGWENLEDVRASPTPTGWSARATPNSDSRRWTRTASTPRVLFPAVSGQRTLDVAAIPGEAYVALARGYNDWLSQEYTAEDPDRLLGLAILPVRDDRRLDRRARARRRRCRGSAASCCTSGRTARPSRSPRRTTASGARAIELDVPLTAHVSFGGGAAAEDRPRSRRPRQQGVSLQSTSRR